MNIDAVPFDVFCARFAAFAEVEEPWTNFCEGRGNPIDTGNRDN
jgi:hypothetical protein